MRFTAALRAYARALNSASILWWSLLPYSTRRCRVIPALNAKAAALKNGEGLHIIQTFEPVPLYPVLALMGFERHTEKVSGSEYHVWFYRVRKGE